MKSHTVAASYYKQNHLKQLRAFCSVMQYGSISTAAVQLNASQPAISLQIQALEREMGCIFFERNGPRIKPTPDAWLFYNLANARLAGLEGLLADFRALRGDMTQGEIRIAAGETAILNILPKVLKQYQTAYPLVRIHTSNAIAKDIPQLLRDDVIDFAIGSLLEEPDDLRYRPISSFSPLLIMPPAHPLQDKADLTLLDIAAETLILPPQYSFTWKAVEVVFAQHDIPLNIRLIAASSEAAKRYVAAGLGVAILTEANLQGTEGLAARDLSHYFAKRSYGIVERRGKYLSPAAQRFVNMMMESALPQPEREAID